MTDAVSAVALWLTKTGVSEVVRYEHIRAELQSRIKAARQTAALHSLADEVQRSTLTPALRAALSHGLRAATDQPVRSVQELAAVVRRTPASLSQAFWRRADRHVTLSQFLGALVILRAHQLRTSGRNWETVCRRLGFARRTLHEKSKRWPGRTLGQLARTPRQELLAQFASDHVHPPLDGPESDRPRPAA